MSSYPRTARVLEGALLAAKVDLTPYNPADHDAWIKWLEENQADKKLAERVRVYARKLVLEAK